MTFKPMLASPIEDTKTLKFPVLVSPKLDGVRATMQGGKLLSRKLKLIPNIQVQKKFAMLPEGIDGELIYGLPTDEKVFSNTTSAVMSDDKPADKVTFFVFDWFLERPYQNRLAMLNAIEGELNKMGVSVVHHSVVNNEEELLEVERISLAHGYEGVMVRSFDGPYKQGRSTLNQGWLLKLKRFKDGEAKIVGFEEEQKNTNEATTDALGHTERSSAKAGLVGKGTLGKFEVTGISKPYIGVGFSVGGGLTAEQREDFWLRRRSLVGKIIKYKYFPTGSVEKPRFPVFLGFRDKRDM